VVAADFSELFSLFGHKKPAKQTGIKNSRMPEGTILNDDDSSSGRRIRRVEASFFGDSLEKFLYN
jgi:hypothetical protein